MQRLTESGSNLYGTVQKEEGHPPQSCCGIFAQCLCDNFRCLKNTILHIYNYWLCCKKPDESSTGICKWIYLFLFGSILLTIGIYGLITWGYSPSYNCNNPTNQCTGFSQKEYQQIINCYQNPFEVCDNCTTCILEKYNDLICSPITKCSDSVQVDGKGAGFIVAIVIGGIFWVPSFFLGLCVFIEYCDKTCCQKSY